MQPAGPGEQGGREPRLAGTAQHQAHAQDGLIAAQLLGASIPRMMFLHIWPNVTAPIIVQATYIAASAVLIEAYLGFLGVGTPPEIPSWGNIIFENQTYFQVAPWLVFFPGAAILILALGFNLLGDGLRDVLDPTQRGRG